ncbi:MAG: phage virion morphogenesis protein [Gemmatimonadales bacterium]
MPYLVRYRLDDDEWRDMSAAITKRVSDLRPVLKQAGEYILLQVDDRFKHERDPDGRPWKSLKAVTLVASFQGGRKRRAFKKRGGETKGYQRFKAGKKILQDAGTRGGLRGSITYEAGRTSLAHGTNKIYGAIHQLGGQAGRGHSVTIDPRSYLGYNARDLAHIRHLIASYIAGK